MPTAMSPLVEQILIFQLISSESFFVVFFFFNILIIEINLRLQKTTYYCNFVVVSIIGYVREQLYETCHIVPH